MSETLSGHSGEVRVVLYLVILGLVVANGYSLYGQAGSSLEGRTIEAGLIESGGRPALYFNLRNPGEDHANYTYVVTYGPTDGDRGGDSSTVTVAPGHTFRYSISLVAPGSESMQIGLRIYGGGHGADQGLLHDQTWVVRAED